MTRLLLVVILTVVTVHLGQAEDEFPAYYTPEQKARMKKFKAEVEASRAKMTDKERAEVNEFLKGLHELCTAKEKKLLYEVNHETIAKEARVFGGSLNWARTAPHQVISFRDDDLTAVPSVIRALKPTSVIVSPDSVHIELGGGLQHQGLTVFREPKGGNGTVEVGKGIWYTSDDNRRFIGQSPPHAPK